MTQSDDTAKAEKAKAKAGAAANSNATPMGFLMTDMQGFLMSGQTSAPARSEEEIEADFDNMPI